MHLFSRSLSLFLLLALQAALTAQIRAEMIDGQVEYQQSGKWKAIDEGRVLSNADLDKVRLGQKSYAEFKRGSGRVSLSAPGIFDIPALFNKAAAKPAESILGTKVRILLQGKKEELGAVAGVRASSQGEDGASLLDFDAEAFVYLKRAQLALGVENFKEAEKDLLFATELAENSGEENPSLRAAIAFHMGICYVGMDRIGQALKILRSASYTDAGEDAFAYLILQTSLNAETEALEEARAILKDALARSSEIGIGEADVQEIEDLLESLE